MLQIEVERVSQRSVFQIFNPYAQPRGIYFGNVEYCTISNYSRTTVLALWLRSETAGQVNQCRARRKPSTSHHEELGHANNLGLVNIAEEGFILITGL